jgi:hypothetical protein
MTLTFSISGSPNGLLKMFADFKAKGKLML